MHSLERMSSSGGNFGFVVNIAGVDDSLDELVDGFDLNFEEFSLSDGNFIFIDVSLDELVDGFDLSLCRDFESISFGDLSLIDSVVRVEDEFLLVLTLDEVDATAFDDDDDFGFGCIIPNASAKLVPIE